MKAIIFDAGPIISLTTNSLLWLLENLKEKYKGEFYISKEVKRELVDNPIETKKFKLEALQVNREINKGVLKVVDNPEIQKIKNQILTLANNSFYARDTPITIVQQGEIGTIAVALFKGADAIVIDERTTRDLIENPYDVANRLSGRLHTKIDVNKNNIEQLKKIIGGLKVIRSIELAMVGYECGWFDKYLTEDKNAKKTLVEAILWGIKIRGASIGQEELDKIVNMEK